MRKNFTLIKFQLLLVLCFSAAVFGQETSGGIEGTVKDPAGAVVPNVTLTITSAGSTASGTTTTGAGSGFRRTVTTNEEGFFRALQVPAGVYEVVSTASSGFGDARYENVVVALGQNTQLEITVTPGTTTTTVDVSVSDAPPVDTTNSAIQTSITAQKIELIPKSTGFTSLLKTVPGTRPETRTGGFSVDGASGSENVFVIDGQEVTNYRTGSLNETYNIPTQLVQEVQVKSSGFNAEYGGATGGVVSVVTRGGNNDFHGEFGMQFEVPKFNGTPRPLLNRFTSGGFTATSGPFVEAVETFDQTKAKGTNFFPTANLSGPVLKDRLWFFGSYSPQIFETVNDVTFISDAPAATRIVRGFDTFRRTRTFEYAFGRLDANPINNLRVTGTYLWNPVVDKGRLPSSSFTNVGSSSTVVGSLVSSDFGGNIGVLSGSELTNRQGGRQTSNLATLDGVFTPTSNFVLNARYSRGFLNEKLGNYFLSDLTEIVCGSASASFPCLSRPSNTKTLRDVSIRRSYELAATYIFDAGGRHELKGGYQRYSITNDVAAVGTRITYAFGTLIDSPTGGFVVPTAGAVGHGVFRTRDTFGFASNLSQGVYIQDKYQPFRRLTLNLGVRFEKENLPSFNEFASPINFDWTDKIAPRLGFAYDVFGDGKTKIFASYGRFFDRVKFELPRGLFGGEVFLEDYFELFPGDTFLSFNRENILGSFSGPSVCQPTGFIAPNARSRCQEDRRVDANDPNAAITDGAVDPNIKPFRQTEFTVGAERQLSRDYVFRIRYTFKNVDEAVEDAGVRNAQNSEAYIIGNPGTGLHLEVLESLGYNKSTRPQRRYDGLEFVIEKRLSNNWYFNANYTFSRLYGNYSGLSSTDEPHLVTGRLSPGVTRAFDLPFIGFTARGEKDNGRLQTDRPHVFNIYGAYIFDWMGNKANSTELSAFQTLTSGTPQTTTIYGASSLTPQILFGRGDLGRSPAFSQTDFNVTHRYRFGRDDRFTMAFDLNFLNLFDQDTVTGVYTTLNPSTAVVNGPALGFTNTTVGYSNGYTSGILLDPILARIASRADRSDERYGLPHLYQSPRVVRFGFRFLF